ncbi:hypothetical protein USDA257_c03900 [Sinorhizobium fredii USDA 257]|uniref:Uncharacterized protein n=1 Tax=Sinorhizobium fredii (strain USDA 257) TaxID=1185652 RepID=I3WZD1_SINF2|nr:hypothetical protein USDA257_c03900 [Sinorhizobium fredii USDA 257]
MNRRPRVCSARPTSGSRGQFSAHGFGGPVINAFRAEICGASRKAAPAPQGLSTTCRQPPPRSAGTGQSPESPRRSAANKAAAANRPWAIPPRAE